MNQMRTDRAIQDNLRNVTQMQQQTAQRNQAINRTLDQNRQFQEQLWRTQDMARRANDQAERDRQMQRNQTDYSRRYDGANSPASAGNAAGPPANPVLPARVPVFAPVAGAAFNVLNAEDRAASRFDLAMRLADAGKLEKARERCEEIIADHPNTRGAAIAKEYLEKTGN
jgi:TolA-binding protein